MRKSIALPLLAAFALAACGSDPDEDMAGDDAAMTADEVSAAADNVVMPEPGEYRSTQELVSLDMPGLNDSMRGMLRNEFAKGAAEEHTFCVTADDAANARDKMLSQMAESDCTVSRFDVSGGTIDGAMSCPAGEGLSGDVAMTGTMGSNGADMVMSFSSDMGGAGTASIKMRVVTERIGDCS